MIENIKTTLVYEIIGEDIGDLSAKIELAQDKGWRPLFGIYENSNPVVRIISYSQFIEKEEDKINKDDEYFTNMHEWRNV